MRAKLALALEHQPVLARIAGKSAEVRPINLESAVRLCSLLWG